MSLLPLRGKERKGRAGEDSFYRCKHTGSIPMADIYALQPNV